MLSFRPNGLKKDWEYNNRAGITRPIISIVMFYNSTVYFEVVAYRKDDDRPCCMAKYRNQDGAKNYGRAIKDRYFRIEINAVHVDENDANNILGADLVAAWENGHQTA